MQYQKVINLLDDTTNEPFKFRTRNWAKINDESRETYNINNQIRFKKSMISSNSCDYSYAYIHVKETISVLNKAAPGAAPNNRNKKVIFKTCASFTSYISEINNKQADDDHDIVVVMPMYCVIEYSDIYTKISGSLWQYYRDEPALHNNDIIIDFPADNNNSISFKFKEKITGQAENNDTKDVEIMVPLKYLH